MGGKSSTPQTTTNITRTEIPDFLRPFLQAQSDAGMSGLAGIQNLVNSGTPVRQVAGFSPAQNQSHQIIQNAMAPGGSMSQTLAALRGFERGDWANNMVPTFNNGISHAINGEFIPGSVTNTLENASAAPTALDPIAYGSLAHTAAGGSLYGTPAFDEAVQASMRAARPSILSGFAGGGQGAIKGGLAQIGMQQAASDAFARLYGDERSRQMAAASQLGQFGLQGREQQLGAASTLGSLGLQQQGLRNQALGTLAGGLNAERDRQLRASMSIPGIGLMGIEALNNAGAQQQAQQQAGLDASNPYTLQQMLLAASQGLPVGSLMGQSGSQTSPLYRNTGAGILGGAASGAATGSMFGPWGTAIGAVAGGLLGGYG